jgi:hypothetical protein
VRNFFKVRAISNTKQHSNLSLNGTDRDDLMQSATKMRIGQSVSAAKSERLELGKDRANQTVVNDDKSRASHTFHLQRRSA